MLRGSFPKESKKILLRTLLLTTFCSILFATSLGTYANSSFPLLNWLKSQNTEPTVNLTKNLDYIFEKNFYKDSKIIIPSEKELSLKISPNSSARISQKISPKKSIYYMDTVDKWTKVRSGIKRGWVENKDLKFKSNLDKLGKIVNPNENYFSSTASARSTRGELAKNEIVEVLFENNKWTKIKTLSGKTGWVVKSSISKAVTEEDVNNYIAKKLLEYEIEDTQKAQAIIDDGLKYLDTKYAWGGTSPSGFDCSGFVKYLFQQRGINVNRVACDQAKNGSPVGDGILKKGDLLFFDTSKTSNLENSFKPSSVSHVGIYMGNKKFLHSSSGAGKVVVSDLSAYYRKTFVTARRLT